MQCLTTAIVWTSNSTTLASFSEEGFIATAFSAFASTTATKENTHKFLLPTELIIQLIQLAFLVELNSTDRLTKINDQTQNYITKPKNE